MSLRALTGLVLVVATCAVFWQVGNHEFLIYDDRALVTENPQVKSGITYESVSWAFSTTAFGNWHPLTWLSHMLDVQLFGLNARGHHLVNVFFHAITGVLLFLLLTELTGAYGCSAFVAAIFLLHPLRVESVAWVAERKDVLSGMFWVLTLWFYSRYVHRPGAARYALTLGSFALGLMSKAMLVTLPVVLLLLDYWPLRRISFARKETQAADGAQPAPVRMSALSLMIEKVPFFLLALALAGISLLGQQGAGAMVDTTGTPIGFRVINALSAYLAYLGKMFWPQNLAVIYPLPATLTFLQGVVAGGLLAVISVAAVLLRGRHPYFVIGWLWYLVTLLPVIGLVQIGKQAMADRYTYIPMIGVLVAITWGATAAAAHIRARRAVLSIAAALSIAACATLSWVQLKHWQNSESLFLHAARVVPDNYVAHNALGSLWAEQGRLQEAVSQYQATLLIWPDDETALVGIAAALAEQGRTDESMRYLERLLMSDPRSIKGHLSMATALSSRGEVDGALSHYSEVVKLDPDQEAAHVSLGVSLVAQGRLEEAMHHYNEALRINPDNLGAHSNIGHALGMQGKLEESAAHFRAVVRIAAEDAEGHYNLGITLARQGKLEESIAHFREALRLRPDFIEAQRSLSLATRMQSQPAEP